MAGILDQVDLRTQLVGENRLELLMFKLHGEQLFGINVFKVQEVQQMPKLTLIPRRHPIIVGVTHVRGQTIPVIDLSKAINMAPMETYDKCNIIIAEYNLFVLAFMVGSVDRIVNLTWDKISSPPSGAGKDHYLTAITRVDENIVEVIDVEKVLAKFMCYTTEVTHELFSPGVLAYLKGKRVLVVDDSTVAMTQVTSIFDSLNLEVDTATSGIEAWEKLLELKRQGIDPASHYLMMITDAEMPGMDGYRLTHQCREDDMLKRMHIVLHTSMSGNFNHELAKKVECDSFIAKFQAESLAACLNERCLHLMSS
ncbi:MAG: chemotaxis protein [Gammaproteobacteria bacterium]